MEDALRKLGFDVGDVHVGRLVELEVAASDEGDARARLDAMCRRLLANPLIEEYEIDVAGGGERGSLHEAERRADARAGADTDAANERREERA